MDFSRVEVSFLLNHPFNNYRVQDFCLRDDYHMLIGRFHLFVRFWTRLLNIWRRGADESEHFVLLAFI